MSATDDPGVVVGDDGLARPVWASVDPLMREYYDTEWGMPVRDEQGMYERISLEAFQAGLSWATILRKRPAFRSAFDGFAPDVVARYGDDDIARLMADAGIVRNARKVEATLTNARAVLALREHGGLGRLFWSFAPATHRRPACAAEVPTTSAESIALANALRSHGFRHVGPTTMYAAMQACGLVDDHVARCHRAST